VSIPVEATIPRATAELSKPAGRIESLDQFRGYTVAGMLLVNFLGGYGATVHHLFRHHNTYNSYADTIMPQFFFAVGFAFRLTFLRRLKSLGARAATAAFFNRSLGLILIGFILYHLDGEYTSWEKLKTLGLEGFFRTAFKRELFQTLVHIALTSIWVLPVIAARPAVRMAYLIGSAALHLLLSYLFYFDFAWKTPVIDGGQLGFLSWSIPLLAGSLAYDLVASQSRGSPVWKLLGWGALMMVVGYGISCVGGIAAPPFVPAWQPINMWTMSQRTGSVSYMTFAAGFSLAVYALFVVLSDEHGWNVGMFRTFGRNALALYILHGLVAQAVKPFVPNDSPLWYVASGFLVYFAINYLCMRGMEKDGIFLKL
jgi:predicted acyltransferase